MKMEKKMCTMCNEEKDISEFIKKCGRCKNCRTEHQKKYNTENPDRKKLSDKLSYEKNKEARRAQQRIYYQEKKEKIMERRKELIAEDPKKHKENQRNRVRRNITGRIGMSHYKRIRKEVSPEHSKNYLFYLDCSLRFLKEWYEFNFTFDGFSWDTYGKEWEIDHVVPCSKFDLTKEDEIKDCFNWKNTKPVLCSFNKKKHNSVYTFQKLEQEIRLLLFTQKNSKANKNITTAPSEKSEGLADG